MSRKLFLVPAVSLAVLTLVVAGAFAQSCCKPAAAVLNHPKQQEIAKVVEEWSASGLQVQVIGGYVKLINGDGETMTAEAISKRMGMEVSDDDLHEAVKLMMAASGAQPKVKSCGVAGDSRCSELTLTSDYKACLLDGPVVASGANQQRYRAEMQLDGKTYEGHALPGFKAVDLQGHPVDVARLQGKPALVALLSANCGHCLRSISTLVRLQKKHPGFSVVAVFVGSSPEAVVKTLGDRKVPASVWVSEDAASMTQTTLLPTFLLTDKRGFVLSRQIGEKRQRQLEERIVEDLAQGADDTIDRVGTSTN